MQIVLSRTSTLPTCLPSSLVTVVLSETGAPPPSQELCRGLMHPGCALVTVVLSETGMTSASFVTLCDALAVNTGLVSLDLSSSEWDPSPLAAVAPPCAIVSTHRALSSP